MVPEASYEPTPEGIVPSSEGWFVLNAREGRWFDGEDVATPYREAGLPG